MATAKKKPAPKPAAKAKPPAPTKKAVKKQAAPANDALMPDDFEITRLPLAELSVSSKNVRKTGVGEGLEELEAGIAARGLLQPLIVQKENGKWKVVAGQRRLLCLENLEEKGKLPPGYLVRCIIAPADADAAEISLMENTMRQAMHPLDMAEAFAAALKEKKDVAKVAHDHGITETIFWKREALSRICPAAKKAFRAGELLMAEAQALTVTDDHKLQDKALKAFNPQRHSAADLRGWLTESVVKASDRRVKFVTLEAYRAAGGQVRADLFAGDDEEATYVTDTLLLDKLVTAKLEAAEKEFKNDGWKWVTSTPSDFNYSVLNDMDTLTAKSRALSKADQVDLKDAQKRLAKIPDRWNRTQEEGAAAEALEEQIEQIEDRKLDWDANTKKISGVMLGINAKGQLMAKRGLIDRKENKKLEKEKAKKATEKTTGKKGKAADQPAASAPQDDGTVELSTRLMEDLTKHRTFGIAAEIAGNPFFALCVTVHTLAAKIIYMDRPENMGLDVKDSREKFKPLKKGEVLGIDKLDDYTKHWADAMPKELDALWLWLLSQVPDDLLKIQAALVACTFNDINPTGRIGDLSGKIWSTMGIDLGQYYAPTADNLFSKLPRTTLLGIVAEARGAPVTAAEDKMKKDALAQLAARECDKAREEGRKTWLPNPLRLPEVQQS